MNDHTENNPSERPQNSLTAETSPYLLQHAHNPVDWYAWNQESLTLSTQTDKPILLSIGYSACHWCHVMAHESFEDEDTAKIMNEHFINIKVDREERPDLDKIYQLAHQMLAQRPGGWPLTMFLMPGDQIPFFGGTYFPDKSRHGLPAFKDLLLNISNFYQDKSQDLHEQNNSLMQAMNSIKSSAPIDGQDATLLDTAVFDIARRELEQHHDKKNGGFGKAPKFPHPSNIERLLRHWVHTDRQDSTALEITCHTLDAMANGGMNDQIGGGFCRYSVDDYWMIPHFEKMLYDNGPLLAIYTYAWLETGKLLYKRTMQMTADWVLAEMQSTEGGFYSSLDADSEGHEGKFYVWTRERVKSLLSEKQHDVFSQHYGLDRDANFEGLWYPHVFVNIETVANSHKITVEEAQQLLTDSRTLLYKSRAQRISPDRDEKILTSWNALMIKGLAVAGRALNNADYITAAQKAFDFIEQNLWKNNRLLAASKDNKAHLNAYLDDYVFLIDAGLELLQAHWRTQDLLWITELAEVVLDQFEDNSNGGFYFTGNDHEKLIQRLKTVSDESIPAGNAVAALALNRLGLLLGHTPYIEAANRCMVSAYDAVKNYASAHNTMLNALEEFVYPIKIILIFAPLTELKKWTRELHNTNGQQAYQPREFIFPIATDADNNHLPEAISSKLKATTSACAYICEGNSCREPVYDSSALKQALKN